MRAARCGCSALLRLSAAGALLLQAALADELGHRFDCGVGLSNWQRAWSAEKKQWCCGHAGLGCSSEPFECEAGAQHWQQEWSAAKQGWCCEHKGVGCRPAAGGDPFDCGDRRGDWEASWPEEKKRWCWKHEVLVQLTGAEDRAPSTYDCVAGYSSWRTEWSPAKKHWCCQYRQLGCAAEPYDCSAGLSDWEVGWSSAKKRWCCDHRGAGCSSAGAVAGRVSDAFECSSDAASGWSARQRDWCCQHKSKGCGDEVFYKKLFTLPSARGRRRPAARAAHKAPASAGAAATLPFVCSLAAAAAVMGGYCLVAHTAQCGAAVKAAATPSRTPAADAERLRERAQPGGVAPDLAAGCVE